MLFIRYFKTWVLPLILLAFSQITMGSEVENKCGEYIFKVKILKGSDIFERRFELYSLTKLGQKIKFYSTESGVSIDTACIKNKKNNFIMIFQEFCGGNGCPEDIYGVFDPKQEKLLISPIDWPNGNYKQVEKLLGYAPPFLSDDDRTFCCSSKQTL